MFKINTQQKTVRAHRISVFKNNNRELYKMTMAIRAFYVTYRSSRIAPGSRRAIQRAAQFFQLDGKIALLPSRDNMFNIWWRVLLYTIWLCDVYIYIVFFCRARLYIECRFVCEAQRTPHHRLKEQIIIGIYFSWRRRISFIFSTF